MDQDTITGNKYEYNGYKPQCATVDQLDRNTFETLNTVNSNGTENRNDILRVGDKSTEQTREFGLASLQKTGYEGDRNYSVTADGVKDIQVQSAQGTASGIQATSAGISSILQSQVGGFKDVALSQCSSTADIIQNSTAGFAAGSLAGANQTASIIYGQKDILLQACGDTDKIIGTDNRNAAAGALQAATIGASSQQSMASGFCGVEKQALDIYARSMQSIDKSFCAVELEMLKNKASLELQASQYKGSSDLLAMSNAKDAETSRQIIAKDAAILANLNYYKLDSLAITNQNALSKQLAECCCETKLMMKDQAALIISDGDKTRSLMRDELIQNLRDAKNDYQRKYEIQSLRVSLPPPLIGAVAI